MSDDSFAAKCRYWRENGTPSFLYGGNGVKEDWRERQSPAFAEARAVEEGESAGLKLARPDW